MPTFLYCSKVSNCFKRTYSFLKTPNIYSHIYQIFLISSQLPLIHVCCFLSNIHGWKFMQLKNSLLPSAFTPLSLLNFPPPRLLPAPVAAVSFCGRRSPPCFLRFSSSSPWSFLCVGGGEALRFSPGSDPGLWSRSVLFPVRVVTLEDGVCSLLWLLPVLLRRLCLGDFFLRSR